MIKGIAHNLNLWGYFVEQRGGKRKHFVFGGRVCRDTPSSSLVGGRGLLGYGLGQFNSRADIPIRGGSMEHSSKNIVNCFFILNLHRS